jgi:hypothetical protein
MNLTNVKYIFIVLAIGLSGCRSASGDNTPFCGDGICAGDETVSTCPVDCFNISFLGVDGQSLVAGQPDTFAFEHLDGLSENGISFYGDEKLFWHNFEPDSPLGGIHVYYWDSYDEIVQRVEAVGGEIAPTIWCSSSWGTVVSAEQNPASMPIDAQDYADFIKAFVERYDFDGGVEDMPGLKSAHNFLQIEDEAENIGDAWAASSNCDQYLNDDQAYNRCAAREYGETLKIAYLAAKEANPDVQIISFSFNPGDFFDDNPKVSGVPENAKVAFLDEVFKNYADYFDIIGLQCNYNFTGIGAWIGFIRNIYNLNKPIMCADAAPMPMLGSHPFHPGLNLYLDRYPELSDLEILDILDDTAHSRYSEIKAWWEAEKARLAIKKAVVTASAGGMAIFYQFIAGTDSATRNAWCHSGMLSSGIDGRLEGPPGTLLPAAHALGQLSAVAEAGYHKIEDLNPLPAGNTPVDWIWIFRFDSPNEPTLISWCGLGGAATQDFSEFFETTNVKVRGLITELDDNYEPIRPSDEIHPANAVPIDESPVFILAEEN